MLELTLHEIAEGVGGVLQGASPSRPVTEISTDTRTIRPGDLFWVLEGDQFDGHDYALDAIEKGAIAVVIRNEKLPGLEIPSIRVADTLYALGEVAKLLRDRMTTRVVGITGSVGKTTTKEFTRSVLSQSAQTKATEGNLNNLIGVPKTLMRVEKDDHWLVLEMGTDRPGEIRRLTEIGKPEFGMVTAVGESHLNMLGSVEKVFEEKSDLLRGLSKDGVAFIPNESAYRDRLIDSTEAKTVTYGVEEGAEILAVDPRVLNNGCFGFVLDTPIGKSPVSLRVPGLHQVQAATAAAAVGVSAGLDLEEIVEGLQSFIGLPGRCEIKELENGVTIIADHYNANPVSMTAAQRLLESFLERRKVMVVGEMWDLGERSVDYHQQVGERIGSGNIDYLIAVGPKTRDLIAAAKEVGFSQDRIRWYETTDQACEHVEKDLKPGDVVLVKGSRGMRLEKVIDALQEGEGNLRRTGGM
ncbi:MAG: UDP-N-acetylmuramoyl-tripeptide--D-alanyl-D-alanine ligase [Candidatus Omnitrophica bacterium]|nr:UDP-N-acetylmuramoyl-tripeptide--D-alanyl-D-alanine ligase [Candidatus Omnitrophota bacterium]